MKTQELLPDLIEIQRSSYKWFLEHGLIEELNSFTPITDYAGKLELHFIGEKYRLKEPKYHIEEAKKKRCNLLSTGICTNIVVKQRNRRKKRTRSIYR